MFPKYTYENIFYFIKIHCTLTRTFALNIWSIRQNKQFVFVENSISLPRFKLRHYTCK